MLAKAMQSFIKKAREPSHKHGEQSERSLRKQGAALADIEISGDNIGTFRKTARDHKIDFALKRDNSTNPPNWIVFFKAKDDKAIQSAFKEYSKVTLKHKTKKPSMLTKLHRYKELARTANAPVKNRNRGGHEL